MAGFFLPSQLVATPSSVDGPQCGTCGLSKTCQSPKMQPTGQGLRRILVVAEAPGADEDARGEQLVGEAGQRLRRELDKFGADLDRDCWKTNANICRPPGNATPTEDQVLACRPSLLATIKALQPETVVLLGGVAMKSLIGWLRAEDVGPAGTWVGWRIPCQRLNAWVCPTYHPSYLLRNRDPVLADTFYTTLRDAFALRGRPWGTVPDYRAQVRTTLDPERAAAAIREFIRLGGTVAFDYETNRLKPDHANAEIVTCAVCWEGRRTIAFPWYGAAVEAMRELVVSPLRKVASNMKFEERWTLRVLGVPVNGWWWDTMLTAHLLDNRPGITSLKFQSFARLGQEDYAAHIKPFFEEGPRGINRIREIPMADLLLYNGMDALLEYHVAQHQLKESGYDAT